MTDTLFLDVETQGRSPRAGKLLMTGWAINDGPIRVQEQPDLEFWKALLHTEVAKVSHTLFDVHWFPRDHVRGPWHDTRLMAWSLNENTPLDLDWLTKHYCGYDPDKRLKRESNVVYYTDDDGRRWDLELYYEWPLAVQKRFKDYCGRDIGALRDLYMKLRQGLEADETLAYWLEEEVPYTDEVIDMERNGLPVNLGDTEVLADELQKVRAQSESRLRSTARLAPDFNLNSPDQLCDYLFSKWYTTKGKLELPKDSLKELRAMRKAGRDPHHHDAIPHSFEILTLGTKYVSGKWIRQGRDLKPTPLTKRKLPNGEVVDGKHPSTSTPDLLYQHGNDSFVRELALTYRKTDKLLGTYLEKFPRVAFEGRIFGRYNQGGTVTGRLSSSDPNLQNIPSRSEVGQRVRALFQGNFIIGDYDALEMRLMAHWSRDPELMRIFAEGLDPHVRTAYALFGVEVDHDDPRRAIGKTINYAVGYGAGPKKLAQVLSLDGYHTTIPVARDYLDLVSGFYKRFFRWSSQEKYRVKETGYVETLAGRRRRLKGSFEAAASYKGTMYGERQAVNSIIQGSAADVIRRGMLAVRKAGLPIRTLAQIHDEAVWEYDAPPTPETLRTIQWCMEQGHGFRLRAPLIFEPFVCDDWSQKGEGSEGRELLEEENAK